MEREGKVARIKELVRKLNMHSHQYYTLDNPEISDQEYDLLLDQLQALEKDTGVILEDSPTQRVGDTILSQFKKHVHKARLWSLDKAQDEDGLRTWINRLNKMRDEYNSQHEEKLPPLSYLVTLKFDGLTINLTYENGILQHAATRGTGEVGEEILLQVQTIKEIPREIKVAELIEVRGEALMTKQAFARYNKEAEIPLKNLRNGAAGALRNLDVRETAKRGLIAYFYDIGYWEGQPFLSYAEMIDFLKNQGFNVHNRVINCTGIEDILKEIKAVSEMRDSFDFAIDGLVIAVNDIKTRTVLGYTVKFPRWAIAYKFAALDVITSLLDVEWNVGRTGKVTPTALLEPVDIGGVTIKRATLNNLDDIKRKRVKKGALVFVRRSNDVIPEIIGVEEESLEKACEIEAPEHCPACGALLRRDGVHLYCENTLSCKPQLIKSMVHYASRDAMNIEGFSEKTAEQLFDELDIREISDLYLLKKEDLLRLNKFKEKKAVNLLTAIKKSKSCTLDAFIYALGIPNVGKKTAHDLAERFGSLQELQKARQDELSQIPDVGAIVAASIVTFFQDNKIRDSIERLLSLGVKPEYKLRTVEDNPFNGKTVVVTGTLEHYNRAQIEQKLNDLGAKISGSVSKNTDYLLVGAEPGTKLEKAKKIISSEQETKLIILAEEEFNSIISGKSEL